MQNRLSLIKGASPIFLLTRNELFLRFPSAGIVQPIDNYSETIVVDEASFFKRHAMASTGVYL
jgi:hypothetical protein